MSTPQPYLFYFTRPMWFISIAFACGILLAQTIKINFSIWILILSCLVIVYVICKIYKYFLHQLPLLFLLICFLSGSAWNSFQTKKLNDPNRLRNLYKNGQISSEELVEVTGRLTNWPEPAPHRIYIELDVSKVKTVNQIYFTHGKIQLVLKNNIKLWKEVNPFPGATLQIETILNYQSMFKNPGGLELSEYLDLQGYDATGIVKEKIVQLEPGTGKSLSARLALLKLRAIKQLENDFEFRTAGLLMASMFGNHYFIDARWADIFRKTNTFHLLVISGSHLALLSFGINWIFGKLFRKKIIIAMGTIIICSTYAMMVGADPPVFRAAIAVIIWQLTKLFYRSSDSLNTIGIATLVLLLIQPLQLFNPGFQLTISAVIALISGAMPLIQKIKEIGKWKPTHLTPYPPRCGTLLRRFAETIYWSPFLFQQEMKKTPITFSLDKSFFASWLENCGIVKLLGKKYLWLQKLNLQIVFRRVFELLIASTIVQIVMLPFNSYYFNRIAPVGLITNIAAEILMSCLLIVVIIYFLSFIFGGLVKSLAIWLVAKTSIGLVYAVRIGVQLNYSSWRIPHLEGKYLWIYGLYLSLIVGICFLISLWQPVLNFSQIEVYFINSKNFFYRMGIKVGVFLLLSTSTATGICILNYPRYFAKPPSNWLRVTFIDVGQGDSALLEFPTGQTMLIDSGGKINFSHQKNYFSEEQFKEDIRGIGERVVSKVLWSRGIKKLDAIVATHFDSDHTQGFSEVVENFPINLAYCSPLKNNQDKTFQTWKESLEQNHIPIQVLTSGMNLQFGTVSVQVLSPDSDEFSKNSDNNNSLVLLVNYKNRSFLFTGDIESPIEHKLVAKQFQKLFCDVLKAPHHGSHTSSTEDFLLATHPKEVIFCAPHKSPYRHPHSDVVERYKNLLPETFEWQTGEDGAITFETDGVEMYAESYIKKERIIVEK